METRTEPRKRTNESDREFRWRHKVWLEKKTVISLEDVSKVSKPAQVQVVPKEDKRSGNGGVQPLKVYDNSESNVRAAMIKKVNRTKDDDNTVKICTTYNIARSTLRRHIKKLTESTKNPSLKDMTDEQRIAAVNAYEIVKQGNPTLSDIAIVSDEDRKAIAEHVSTAGLLNWGMTKEQVIQMLKDHACEDADSADWANYYRRFAKE